MREHLKSISSSLNPQYAVDFILNFFDAQLRLLRAFDRIREVFLYFDSAFLQPKMGFSVETELTRLSKTLLFDCHGDRLLPLLQEFVRISEEPLGLYAFIVAEFRRVSPGA